MRATPDADYVAYVSARQRQLLRAAWLVCGDRQLAEDLLQEALVKLALRWGRVRLENPDAWVRTVLYRDAVSSWRRRRREVVADLGTLEPAGLGSDWSGGADDGSLEDLAAIRVDLARALDTLTPKQRAVVVLRYFDDRSVGETADILGVSEGTVKSQTSVALGNLRAALPSLVMTEDDR